jgi:hypothetical protein
VNFSDATTDDPEAEHDDREREQHDREGRATGRQAEHEMPRLHERRRADPQHHREIAKVDHLGDERADVPAADAEERAADHGARGAGLGRHHRHRADGRRAEDRPDDDRGQRTEPIEAEGDRQRAHEQ